MAELGYSELSFVVERVGHAYGAAGCHGMLTKYPPRNAENFSELMTRSNDL